MMWWMVVLMSAGLIGLGVGLLIRDIVRPAAQPAKRKGTLKTAGENAPSKFASAVSRLTSVRATSPARRSSKAAVVPPVVETPTLPPARPVSAPRLPAVEGHWPRLRPEIDAAVASVNQAMAPLSLSLGAPGDATWSLHNEGFGDYRRVLIDRDSVAWLRLEIGADLAMAARLRAHDADNTVINRDCVVPARRATGQLVQALTDALSGVFEQAVARHSDIIKNQGLSAPAQMPPPTSVARGTASLPPAPASAAAKLVDDSVALVNRAFAEVGAELLVDKRHGPVAMADDRALSITVHGVSVGLMLVEPRAEHIDISVGVADLKNFNAARRQSQAIAGLTVQVLAEAIATNAWPAIAAASAQPPAA